MTELTSQQSTLVPFPEKGETIALTVEPGANLLFAFDPGMALASRTGNDLVFETEDGGTVTITDFFIAPDDSLPDLIMPDETVIAAVDFFSGSDLDLATASGDAGASTGGGTGYNDDPGSLTTGVDKSGILNTDYWSQSSGANQNMAATSQGSRAGAAASRSVGQESGLFESEPGPLPDSQPQPKPEPQPEQQPELEPQPQPEQQLEPQPE
ncbi:hypothetical protein LJB81_00515, partial [Desulfovibrio sp. OttesenSCG-928-M14]|nr:hypothetical protein [Desulfovibrio sp. OttesenSCG-928-M14]